MPALVPPVADERDGLVAYLDQQRDSLATTAFGLTEEQLRATPTAGTLSIGGLLKHLATMESSWVDRVDRGARRADAGRDDAGAGRRLRLRLRPHRRRHPREPAGRARRGRRPHARACSRDADLDTPVPVPRDAPWFPKDVPAWSVRWVALHLIEEAARHAGHADIVRESIDGATMYELVAGREGWPATPWLTPWQPA